MEEYYSFIELEYRENYEGIVRIASVYSDSDDRSYDISDISDIEYNTNDDDYRQQIISDVKKHLNLNYVEIK